MRKILLLLAFFAWMTAIQAKPRTTQELMQKAQQVLCKDRHGAGMRTKAAMQILRQRDGVVVLGNASDGFAVMTIDDAFPAVMGYSLTTFDYQTTNPNFRWWLAAVEEMAKAVPERTISRIKPDKDKYPEEVAPFMKTRWGQSAPFNSLCPKGCPTGCVATAAAQVIRYNQWPVEGKGSAFTYYPFGDFQASCLEADIDSVHYDYANMLNRYDAYTMVTKAQKNAVSQLMYHVGLSMKAMYDEDGTGAYNETLCHGLRVNFSYPYAVTINSDDYSANEWMDIIFDQLSKNVPLVYGGSDMDYSGHEFVLHGYDSDGMVYINWGWNGAEDGYFDLSSLLVHWGLYNFNYFQDVVLRCSPEWIETDTLYVEVATPGTLHELLTPQQQDSIICLSLKGVINSTDIKTLRKMAGCTTTGKGTRGCLSVLDLSDVRIVAGGEPYLLENGMELTTSDDEMPYKAFEKCSFLIDVTLPTSLVRYSDGVFAGCNNLDRVRLAPGEQSEFVVDGSFVMNKERDELIECLPGYDDVDYVIPSGVRIVHDYSFACRYLYERISLPASVEKVGKYAFNRCFDLVSTYVYAEKPPQIDDTAIDELDLLLRTLYVPKGTRGQYQKADGWKKYAGRIKEFEAVDGIDEKHVRQAVEGSDHVYDIMGRRVENAHILPSGIYVVNGQKKVVR